MLPNACRSNGVKAIGTKTALGSLLLFDARGGNSNRSGITPTIVYGSRSRVIVRPTIAASRPNAPIQRPWVMTATFAFARSSSGVSARPIAGDTPRTPNSSGDTCVPTRRCGSAMPDSS